MRFSTSNKQYQRNILFEDFNESMSLDDLNTDETISAAVE